MNQETNETQPSEFEQKLNESRLANQRTEHDTHTGEALSAPAAGDAATIPVIEEQLQVSKKTVESGRVRVSKSVHQEEATVEVPTIREEVNVERVAINEYVDAPPPAVRYEGDKTIIPVLREEVVLVKRIVLVEELHITKRRVQTQESQQVTLRKEEVHISRASNDNTTPHPA